MADSRLAERAVPLTQGQPVRPRFGWFTDRWIAISFLTPTMALLLFITVFPLAWSLYLSFTDWSVIRDAGTVPNWIGLRNYGDLLTHQRTWERFVVTGQFVVPAVTIELLLGFGIAMLLNRRFTGRGVIMTMLLIPMMLSPIVVALFWRFMMQGEGVINYYVVNVLGAAPILWLTDRWVAPWSLVIVDVWMWTPFMMLISLAGLSAVPKYLYEAAAVDRASAWFRFRHITLPMVAPLLLIAVIFRTMDAYKLFDQALVLTGGGPGRFTQTASLYLYDLAFGQFRTGEASALGYIMLIVIIALANLFIRALNSVKASE